MKRKYSNKLKYKIRRLIFIYGPMFFILSLFYGRFIIDVLSELGLYE